MVIQITRKTFIIASLLVLLILAYYLSPRLKPGIRITDIKMTTALNEELMPTDVMEVFPKGTAQVYCWIQWQDTKVNTEIVAKWHYLTDDINILNYSFAIPRKQGAGGISLRMPEGRVLPAGTYRIDIAKNNIVLKSFTFKVK